MKQTSRVKKVKAWAIVTTRGCVTGMAPYQFYSQKKFADYYAKKANLTRGGGLRIVPVTISYTLPKKGS